MPLAAHAVWQGETLELQVALGHPTAPLSPLLRVTEREVVATDAGARALGERAADGLRGAGAAAYLGAAAEQRAAH